MKDHIIEMHKLQADYLNTGGTLTKSQWHTTVITSLAQWSQMDLYADSIEDPEKLICNLELKELHGFGKSKKTDSALQTQQSRWTLSSATHG